MEAFFKAEQSDLLKDLNELPRNAAVRKVNMVISIWAHDRVWASLQL
jgi:hypothetical protein